MRLLEIERSGKEIHVLYFGDFDPSGDDMDDHLDNALRYFGLGEIDFQRIAETIDKVNHDTRKDGFIKKYGKLYIVELDALLAIVRAEFKRIVRESVDQFFDQRIYQAILSDHRPDLLDRLVQERIRFI